MELAHNRGGSSNAPIGNIYYQIKMIHLKEIGYLFGIVGHLHPIHPKILQAITIALGYYTELDCANPLLRKSHTESRNMEKLSWY